MIIFLNKKNLQKKWILKDIPANVTEFNEGKLFGVALENHAKTKELFNNKFSIKKTTNIILFKLIAIKIVILDQNLLKEQDVITIFSYYML